MAARGKSLAERRAERAEIDDPAVVLEAALRFLEARARSEAEVRRRLTSAGYRSDLVDGAVVRLAELGILDDEAFARAWVESRDRAKAKFLARPAKTSGSFYLRLRSHRAWEVPVKFQVHRIRI